MVGDVDSTHAAAACCKETFRLKIAHLESATKKALT